MGWRLRFLLFLTSISVTLICQTGSVRAQPSMSMPTMSMPAMPTGMSPLGPLAMPQGQVSPSAGSSAPTAPSPIMSALGITDSYVSIIDPAVPRSNIMLRLDLNYSNVQPMRGEYIVAKGGVPNSNGFPMVETKISYQDLTTYAEYAVTPWASVFVEAPFRWMNPEVNGNASGFSDMKYGLKLCTWTSDTLIATGELRLYQPTARNPTLGTGHWSIEPGLLAAYRFNPQILLEGELRYWMPIGGSDFAGDLIRYGVGGSWGQRNPSGGWVMPVVEAVGWTMLNGKTMIAATPDSFVIEDARGQTIVNGYFGLRWGYGANFDAYLGYGRCFTGDAWQRDLVRFEIRFIY